MAAQTRGVNIDLSCENLGATRCNNSSRGFRRAPDAAIGAVKLQLVTSGRCTGTAARSNRLCESVSLNAVLSTEPINSRIVAGHTELIG
jgi:hypothetical protein